MEARKTKSFGSFGNRQIRKQTTNITGNDQDLLKMDCVGLVMCRRLQRQQRLNVTVSLIAGFYAGANLAFGVTELGWPPCHGLPPYGPDQANCKPKDMDRLLKNAQYISMCVFNIANLIALTSSPRGDGAVGFQRAILKLAVMINILLSVTAFLLALISLDMWGEMCAYLTYANEVSVFVCGYEMLLVIATDCKKRGSKVPFIPALAQKMFEKYPDRHIAIVVVIFLWLRVQFIHGKFFLAMAAISLFVFTLDNLLICEKNMAEAGRKMRATKGEDGAESAYVLPELFKLRRQATANVWVGILSAMYCSTAFGFMLATVSTWHPDGAAHGQATTTTTTSDSAAQLFGGLNGSSQCAWLGDCHDWKDRHYPITSTGLCVSHFEHHDGRPRMVGLTVFDSTETFVAFVFNIMMLIAVVSMVEHGKHVKGFWIKVWMIVDLLGSFMWLMMGLVGVVQVDVSRLFGLFGFSCGEVVMTLWDIQYLNEYTVVYPCLYYIIREGLAHASMNNLVPLRVLSKDTQTKWAEAGGHWQYFMLVSIVFMVLKGLLDHYVPLAHPCFLFFSGLVLFFFAVRNWIISEEKMQLKAAKCRGWAHHFAIAVDTTRRQGYLVMLSIFACVFCASNIAWAVLAQQHVFMMTPYAAYAEIFAALVFNIVNVFALTLNPGRFADDKGTGNLAKASLGKFMLAMFVLVFFACTNFCLALSVDFNANMNIADNVTDFESWQNGSRTSDFPRITMMTRIRWLTYVNTFLVCLTWIYAWGLDAVAGTTSHTPYVTAGILICSCAVLRGGRAFGITAGYMLFNSTMEGFQDMARENDEDQAMLRTQSSKPSLSA